MHKQIQKRGGISMNGNSILPLLLILFLLGTFNNGNQCCCNGLFGGDNCNCC